MAHGRPGDVRADTRPFRDWVVVTVKVAARTVNVAVFVTPPALADTVHVPGVVRWYSPVVEPSAPMGVPLAVDVPATGWLRVNVTGVPPAGRPKNMHVNVDPAGADDGLQPVTIELCSRGCLKPS